MSDRILILDFGSQVTQLIARRVRESGVYCEILPFTISEDRVRDFDPRGIILSGGPASLTEAASPRAPEIVWLQRFFVVPPLTLAVIMYLAGGVPWLLWGFCLPTMTLAHATFAINTVNHMFGSRRFETVDESRNNVLTALFAVGEGWHNNHHRYQRAARNGFYWWEFDPTWYVIRAMAAVGIAWDLQAVPTRIYEEARASYHPIARTVVESILG